MPDRDRPCEQKTAADITSAACAPAMTALSFDQRAEQGNANHAAGLPRRVQYARGDAGSRLLDTAEQRRGQADGTSRPSPPPRIMSCAPIAQPLVPEAIWQQRNAARGSDHTSRHKWFAARRERPLTDAVIRLAGSTMAIMGTKAKARCERRPAIDVLEVETEHEDQAVEGNVEEDPNQSGQREHAMAEQRQRQHRLLRICLAPDEQESDHGAAPRSP